MGSVQYAKFEQHSCPLADDVCFHRMVSHYAKFLCSPNEKELAETLDAKIPRYVRGPKKAYVRVVPLSMYVVRGDGSD